MTRWEYRLVEIPYGPGEESYELGRLGQDGWEAVGMHVREGANEEAPLHPYTLMVLMKRPAKTDSAGAPRGR